MTDTDIIKEASNVAELAHQITNKDILDRTEIEKLNEKIDEFMKQSHQEKVYFKRLV